VFVWMDKETSQMDRKFYCYCDECGFQLEKPETWKVLKHLLTDLDGAIVSDGEGGYISICPKCKEDSLVLTD
jgi:hypothetical protein